MSLVDQSQQAFPTSVQVTVHQARHLRPKGKNGTNDAYAIIQVAKDKFSTAVVEKSMAPMWKEEASFSLPLFHPGNVDRCTLYIIVMHRVQAGLDKFLGQAVVNLVELHENKARQKPDWFPLVDKSGKSDKLRGDVLLGITFMRNNMSASMVDLSVKDKHRSRISKLKDKVRLKKKDSFSDSGSAMSQVLTDSEGDRDSLASNQTAGEKKKSKFKNIFAPKSNLQRNTSQSMSTLGSLPGRSSSLSGSRSSGINVETPEVKKKFKFLGHKRSGSSDSKGSLGPLSFLSRSKHSHSDVNNPGINSTQVYAGEPEVRSGSTVSLSSSGQSSMENVHQHNASVMPDSHVPFFGSESRDRLMMEERRRQEEEERSQIDAMRLQEEEERQRRWLEEENQRKLDEYERNRRFLEEEERREKQRQEEEERRRLQEIENEERLRIEELKIKEEQKSHEEASMSERLSSLFGLARKKEDKKEETPQHSEEEVTAQALHYDTRDQQVFEATNSFENISLNSTTQFNSNESPSDEQKSSLNPQSSSAMHFLNRTARVSTVKPRLSHSLESESSEQLPLEYSESQTPSVPADQQWTSPGASESPLSSVPYEFPDTFSNLHSSLAPLRFRESPSGSLRKNPLDSTSSYRGLTGSLYRDPPGSSSQSPSGSPSRSPPGSPSTRPLDYHSRNLPGSPSRSPPVSPSRPLGYPSRSPAGSPSRGPLGSPSRSPLGSPSRSPLGSPSRSPLGSPSRSPLGSPSRSPPGSPSRRPLGYSIRSPPGSPSRSPPGSPSRRPLGFPSSSPPGSPGRSPPGSLNRRPPGSPSRRPLGYPSSPPGSPLESSAGSLSYSVDDVPSSPTMADKTGRAPLPPLYPIYEAQTGGAREVQISSHTNGSQQEQTLSLPLPDYETLYPQRRHGVKGHTRWDHIIAEVNQRRIDSTPELIGPEMSVDGPEDPEKAGSSFPGNSTSLGHLQTHHQERKHRSSKNVAPPPPPKQAVDQTKPPETSDIQVPTARPRQRPAMKEPAEQHYSVDITDMPMSSHDLKTPEKPPRTLDSLHTRVAQREQNPENFGMTAEDLDQIFTEGKTGDPFASLNGEKNNWEDADSQSSLSFQRQNSSRRISSPPSRSNSLKASKFQQEPSEEEETNKIQLSTRDEVIESITQRHPADGKAQVHFLNGEDPVGSDPFAVSSSLPFSEPLPVVMEEPSSQAQVLSVRKKPKKALMPPSESLIVSPQISNGDNLASTLSRPHPVKPMHALESPNPTSTYSLKDMHPQSGTPKKVAGIFDSGPFTQLTHEELITLVVRQQADLSKKDSKISELEEYIDNLLVRVIEEKPTILHAVKTNPA
ncbi:rab11 family-interacting protein 1 [Syngnathus typhle]|uniref:rab11 family-interacting protein 1 n=1 Tax=Syngnathus typhle TaxID=161592 RepID=UPI002A6A1CC1|nr:rab11 family-interacting protein 1 [Syngnathus typhle]XP_061134179.1 rab11 family-interacting protein 1 [Syngnathus typhle]